MSLFELKSQTFLSEVEIGDSNFQPFDIYFANFMAQLADTQDPVLIKIFAELSQCIKRQDSCLDLVDSKDIIKKLADLHCVTITQTTETSLTELTTPLILMGNKLFLQRYFTYEHRISEQLINRNNALKDIPDLSSLLDVFFPKRQASKTNNQEDKAIDWQKVAVIQCLTRQLNIITGGPGTGKTTIVAKILAALNVIDRNIKIKLAAPTGKAAARLTESITAALSLLPDQFNHNATKVSTIHRLLGMRFDGNSYLFDKENKIDVDLLIIDEVSMIDLAMFDRLLAALPSHCRLILLGDPDQLLSVEAGAVMADITGLGIQYSDTFRQTIEANLGTALPIETQRRFHALQNALCHLSKSYRFSDEKGIGNLANTIRQQLIPNFKNDDQVNYVTTFTESDMEQAVINFYQPYVDQIMNQKKESMQETALTLLKNFNQCRVLVPFREGPTGITALNKLMDEHLQRQLSANLIDGHHYHGQAIMITQNDYQLELYNGDIGVCILSSDNALLAAFPDQNDTIKFFLLSRLPTYETCFVMSVHKSQGSEFDHVSLIIPATVGSQGNELLTRELVYTAVTRAKSNVTIYASKERFSNCLQTSNHRTSGLRERFQSKLPIIE